MRIAYANTLYKENISSGHNVHVFNFVKQAVLMGHEIWTWPKDQNPNSLKFSNNLLTRFRTLKNCDVIYIRLEDYAPTIIKSLNKTAKLLLGNPIVVWEFNTIPEFGLIIGKSKNDVDHNISILKNNAEICDLAVCVSERISSYVKKNFGIKNIVTVPNGSDYEMFNPNIEPFHRMKYFSNRVNAVWLGSTDIPWGNFDLLKNTAEILYNKGFENKIAFHILGNCALGLMRDMPPNVIYQGQDDYHSIPRWLSGMDIGMMLYKPGPGDYSSPLKLFDYMASGLLVVCTKQPQSISIINELNFDFNFVIDDEPSALSDLLIRVINDKGIIIDAGNQCRNLIINKYSWKRNVETIISSIENIMHNR